MIISPETVPRSREACLRMGIALNGLLSEARVIEFLEIWRNIGLKQDLFPAKVTGYAEIRCMIVIPPEATKG